VRRGGTAGGGVIRTHRRAEDLAEGRHNSNSMRIEEAL